MIIKFVVHGIQSGTDSVDVNVNGQTLNAAVEAMIVELTSDHYGSLVLKLIGNDLAEAKAKNTFVIGETVTWTL